MVKWEPGNDLQVNGEGDSKSSKAKITLAVIIS